MGDTHIVTVALSDVENAICMSCQRSVIGICPHRGNEPYNPEKVTCPTLRVLRGLPQYSISISTEGRNGNTAPDV